jgi:lipopolysaccharide transport system permease protein
MTSLAYLYWQWLRRDLAGRYRGSLLGLAWPVLQPLSQILVFTLVFHQFMRMRWPAAGGEGSALDYALNVFAGMAVFNFLAEVLNRAPAAILGQPNLVTKVRFPLTVLPAVIVGAAALHLVVGAVAVSLAMIAFRDASVLALLLPLFLLPMLLYGLGLALGLAALGVYLRDIAQVMPALTSLLMFLTPIFYPATLFPPQAGHRRRAAWAGRLRCPPAGLRRGDGGRGVRVRAAAQRVRRCPLRTTRSRSRSRAPARPTGCTRTLRTGSSRRSSAAAATTPSSRRWRKSTSACAAARRWESSASTARASPRCCS